MATKIEQPLYILHFRDQSGEQKPFRVQSWKYWEILGELIWRKIDRLEAIDAAKWATKAKPGMKLKIGQNYILEVKA